MRFQSNLGNCSFPKVVLLFSLLFFFGTSDAQVNLSGGFSLGVAPNISYVEGRNGLEHKANGNIFSVFTELRFYEKFLARAQYTKLDKETLMTEFSENFEYGYTMTGSVGYAVKGGKNTKYEFPVYLNCGAGVMGQESTVTDISMHFGMTVAPRIRVYSGLWIIGEFRYLKGIVGSDYTGAISMADISGGLRYEF